MTDNPQTASDADLIRPIILRLTDAQFLELERRLVEAEVEWAVTQKRGPKQEALEFAASEFLRYLVDEVKQWRGL